MQEDLYEVLGIRRDATDDQISSAYRNLARKYHPDLNPDDAKAKEKFQQVQQAHEILGDQEKRAKYDQFGHAAFAGAQQAGPGGPNPFRRSRGGQPNFQDVDLSHIFGGDFGGGSAGGGGFSDLFRQFSRGSREPKKGNDLSHQLAVDFRTAIDGGEVTIPVRRENGENERITVKIPAGIEDGKKIRLRGQGAPSPSGGPRGDIIITVKIKKHSSFARRGNDLEIRVPVTLAEAANGASIDVPTPKGTISLKIPPCTSSGKKLRIKGHGVPGKNGEFGDLYAEVLIVLPSKLTDEQVSMIAKMSGQPANPRSDLRW